MSIADDLGKLLAIKEDLFKSIRTKTDIPSDTLFEDYCKKIDAIEVASNKEKPFFTFFSVQPIPKDYVFGGGVSKEMGGIYFDAHVGLFDIVMNKQIAIGKDSWGTKGVKSIGEQYLFFGDVNVPSVTFVKAQPTCTDKIFGPEKLVCTESYTPYGNLTVDSDLIATNFGSSSYVSLDCRLPERCKNWEFVMKFNCDSYSDETRFLVSDPVDSSGHFGIALGCNSSSQLWLFLSSDGSSYDIALAVSGTQQLSANKDYWVKLAFDGSEYVAYLSEDGQNFERDITVSSSTFVFSPQSNLEIGVHGTHHLPQSSKVYLKDTYLKVEDTMFWKINSDNTTQS